MTEWVQLQEGSFTLQNNLKDLGPSYKMDLDFFYCFWSEKAVLPFQNSLKNLGPSYKMTYIFWNVFEVKNYIFWNVFEGKNYLLAESIWLELHI